MNQEIEIEFLDWVHPKLGVTKVEVEGGKPLILKAKIKFSTSEKCTNCASLEDELERTRIKAAVWKSAYDVEVGYNEQEPVACIEDGDLYFADEIDWQTLQQQGIAVQLLYTTPPQRTWVGLSEDDILLAGYGGKSNQAVRWAEAKLRSKNGY